MQRDQRLLDPICGLIAFDRKKEADRLAWELLNSRAFRRLGRIRQLGLSDIVFPGATHSRFAHSLGVFDNARRILAQMARRSDKPLDKGQSLTVLIAALLHDVGHGPMSHAFEAALAGTKHPHDHEKWGARILREDEEIARILDRAGLGKTVAGLLDGSQPGNAYAAIVSSQFDADRLDYLRRDRYMTGVGSGGFDFFWLLDCLDITPAGSHPHPPGSLCLSAKGLRNAEEYIMARYYLYQNVYFHKTVRGAELMMRKILGLVVKDPEQLPESNPLREYFTSPSCAAYLALDDSAIWQALKFLAARRGGQPAGKLANRFLGRDLFKCADVSLWKKGERLSFEKKALKAGAEADVIPFSAYVSRMGKKKAGEKILIHDRDRKEVYDIAAESPLVRKLTRTQHMRRFYFSDAKTRDQLLAAAK